MTTTQILVVADVPDDQQTAAQAAAAAFVASLPDNAEGTVIVAATFGGESIIPTAREAFDAALAELETLNAKTPRASAQDVAAAIAKLDTAARALELTLTIPEAPAAPAPSDWSDGPTSLDPGTVAATAPAPIGEDPTPDPAPAPAEVPAGTPLG